MDNGHLVLGRELHEGVIIDGGIAVRIHRIMGKRVWLSFVAPKDVRIVREELECHQGDSGKREAA